MNKNIRLTENQLLLENEELHRHVYELEETLNSIRNGEIDAIIVSGVDGDNIYSLTSVETKYRIIIEQMYEGAITLTKDGLITYCNARFAELVSEPYERIIGAYFVNLLQQSEAQKFLGLFKAGLGGKSVGELVYIKNNGRVLNLHLSVSALPAVIQNGVCILFTDITELKRQEEDLISLNVLLEQKVFERTSELYKTIEDLVLQQEATIKLSEELVKAKDILEAKNDELVREVSERKLAEEKVLGINQRFELGIESAKMAWWEMDIKTGNVAFHNRKAEMLGFAPENFKHYTDFMALVHPDDSEKLMDSMRNHLHGLADKYEGEYRIINNKGEYLWFYDIGKVSKNEPSGANHKINGIVLDITKNKHVENDLKETNQRLELALISSKAGTWDWDMSSAKLYWSPQLFGLFGLDPLKTIASFEQWRSILHPEDIELAENRIGQALKDHTLLNSDYRVILPNGQIRWINACGEGIYDKEGKPLQMIGLCIDITERKKSQAALVENERLLRESQSVARIGSFSLDLSTGLWKSSELLDEIFGIDGNFIRSIDGWISIICPDMQKQMAEYFANEVLGKQQNFDKEYQIIRQNDGSLHWVHGIAGLEFNQDNQPVKMFGTISDITERMLIQEKVNYLAAIIQSTDDAIISKDINGNITSWNSGAVNLFGYQENEMLGHSIKRIIPIERLGEEAHILNKIKKGEKIDNFETVRVTKNGQLIHVSITYSSILNNSGQIIGVSIVVRDITEHKKLIEKLEVQNTEMNLLNIELKMARDKAEESDRLKSAFLSNMSHEIRTPMNGIMGFTELLKDFDLTNEEQQQYILIIQKAGNRLLNIINDIIDISKIESGLMNVNISQSNINEQIEFIHSFFKTEVERKGMKLHYKTTLPEINAFIFTDREKLFAILTNLVKNAIKYTDRGSIEFGYHLVETHGRASILKFYVKDTGIGIPKDRQEAVFQRFIQADIVDKMARQGAGLGLTISKAYVEMLGGNIGLESEEGVGSTFYFTLPYQTKLNGKNGIPHEILITSEEIQMKKLKILLVEDDEISIELLGCQVSMNGNEILEARTGLEAIDIFHANPDIDLILMDIQMPDMTGYEATRQIRQFDEKVVIIAQTAFAMGSEKKKAIDAGCTDYIAKPILKASLLGLINKYFKKEMNN